MFRPVAAASLLLLCAFTAAAAGPAPGFREVVVDAGGPRPLHVALWYPTEAAGPVRTVGENPAFVGVPVVRDAAPAPGAHPLVVLSHGYGGSWRNLSWLAAELVAAGHAVAAPDHPGTTTFDRDPARAARLRERPRDLARTIDHLLADPSLAGAIDPERIAAAGHSLGGWTAAALAGARFDPARFARDCEAGPSARACALADELGLADPALAADLGDARLKAFVTLDLGLARGFSPDSLAAVAVPALVFGAGVDIGGMPADAESGWLAARLPQDRTRLVLVPDAMHFSFMQLCKDGAAERIEREMPGDGIVCRDGGDRGRGAIHAETAATIVSFLREAFAAH